MQHLASTHLKLYEEFVKEITTKSDGVFLWVDLVVKSLLRGSQNRDDLPQLQHRLGEFPITLGQLYQHVLDRINPRYFLEASRILLIYESAAAHAPWITPLNLDLANTGTY